MLKWLRKYQKWILVIGGSLLMVAFLMPEAIQNLGRSPLFSYPMKVQGSRVSHTTLDAARKEYFALNALVPGMAQIMGAGDSVEHWYLLSKEAEKGGFVGGKGDGEEFLFPIARSMLRFDQSSFFLPPDQLDQRARETADLLRTQGVARVAGETRLSQDDVFRALGKLRGVNRMRQLYIAAPRFSDRRLAAAVKETSDAARVDYLIITPDRELQNIPDPDPAALQAHFDRFKAVKPGEGEFGIGYLLPDRVKIASMRIDRDAILAAMTADPLEVRKRFLRAHPTGQLPAGQSESAIISSLETAVRTEQTEKALRVADLTVKSELERATRRLDTDGAYRRLPEDFAAPTFERLRDLIVDRIREATGATIPAPTVEIRAADWLTREQVSALPDIGSAFRRTGTRAEMFPDLVFRVRELVGQDDSGLQVGLPFAEPVLETLGGRHYFTVLDAKKESAPESLEEVRAKAVTDYKRLAAFDILKTRLDTYRDVAAAQGLETLGKSGSPDGAGNLTPRTGVRVDGTSVGAQDPGLNTEEFRKAVLDAARKLDPLADVTQVPAAERTVAVALPGIQSVAVAQITAVSPVTIETFRTQQVATLRRLLDIDGATRADDPYSLANMEKRFNVVYTGGRDSAATAAPAADDPDPS